MTCEYCGQDKEDVILRPDPFDLEVDGDTTEYYMCDDCAEERSREI